MARLVSLIDFSNTVLMRHTPTARRSQIARPSAMALVVALAVALLSALAPAPARAAELPASILDGGYIISDAEFFDSGSMSVSEVQQFLETRVPTCKATDGPLCLRDFRMKLPGRAADAYCGAITARADVSAAHVIVASARACGINPKVILVMLQKEQGLVTSTKPTEWSYRAAMGMNCPDTAPCDAASAGFVNQVILGARQQQVYAKNPTRYNYRAGQVNTVKWHPNSSCGSSKVFIQNQATANLYIYTPYRPNLAALAAGYAAGDSCSSYGNRNFYNYYVQWFAPDANDSAGAPALIDACTAPAAADVMSATGSLTTTAATVGRRAPTNGCNSGSLSIARGTKVSITGSYGAWRRVSISGQTRWVPVSALPASGSSAGQGACAVPAESAITKAEGQAVVLSAALNGRKAPMTSCATGRITLTQGASYARTGVYGSWWRLTANGSTYWAHSDYLKLADAKPTPAKPTTPTPTPTTTPKPTPAPTPAKPVETITMFAASPTHLRPSAGSPTLGFTLRKGQKVSASTVDGQWSKVSFGDRSGWVVTSKLAREKPATETARTRQAVYKTPVRQTASRNGQVLKTVTVGDEIEVLETFGAWRAVTVGSVSGWMQGSHLAALATPRAMQTTVAAKVRATASASGKVWGTLRKAHPVTVRAGQGSWRLINYGSRTAWVHKDLLKNRPAATLRTTTTGLNLRSSASTSARIVTVLAKGTQVRVVAGSGVWRKVAVGSRTGWVHGKYLK